ncbi:erythromycin esterase family protein [Arenibaculum pallidiluteum]|uniref:erythromycin esterase family protein n=1 Tax=Arenibaculum pallidiluteum TaxID=2812559 RepID=UPI001A97D064|nr:erythromycin esterase family protein [Arenibaculum pallidiluteum]
MTGTEADAERLSRRIARAARPLAELDDPEFAAPSDVLGSARVVLLGEASHGTSEFYRARAAITRRLVERHGFTIVAVEADWPDAAQIDAFVRGGERPSQADGPPFRRFPTWMWRNREMAGLLGWLRAHNAALDDPARCAGFFGLDLYSLDASIEAVLAYLDGVDPETAREARRRYACLEPWQRHPEVYGRVSMTEGFGRCEAGVLKVLTELLERRLAYGASGRTAFFDAARNARVVAAAERYYRAMFHGDDESWNLRDSHMAETLGALLDWHAGAKAVVWAHNSHIGDARATGMTERGELNLGQLCRERYGQDAVLVGFGTHTGTVAAADDWDEPMEVMRVLPSRPDSIERPFHDAGIPRLWLDLRPGAPEQDPGLIEALAKPRIERFIGVVYRPGTERWSHYVEARLSRQFDHYVFFDETSAVTPLPGPEEPGAEETFPFGL